MTCSSAVQPGLSGGHAHRCEATGAYRLRGGRKARAHRVSLIAEGESMNTLETEARRDTSATLPRSDSTPENARFLLQS